MNTTETTVTNYINNILAWGRDSWRYVMLWTIIIRRNELLKQNSELVLWGLLNKYFHEKYITERKTLNWISDNKDLENDFKQYLESYRNKPFLI